MRVFVTDGENRAALAITRSLGRLGHHVIVGDTRQTSLAQMSRYCSERVQYPEPTGASEAFVDTVARVTRERQVDVLIPVADITTFLVASHRSRFSCVVACGDYESVQRAADKVDILQTAERIGVPTPKSLIVSKPTDPIPAVDELGFPVVIKPWRSRIWTPQGWASTSVSYAADTAELARDLARRPAHEFPVLLQERITGRGLGVFVCFDKGKMVAEFSHRRLRERPPWGGVSVLSESVMVDPAARRYAIDLLNEIHWQGVAMVEFKQDPRDGLPKLMEINGRFWGSLQLAIDAGVDFPALLVQGATGHPFEPQPAYRVGVRNRWFWGDVDSLLVALRRDPSAPVFPNQVGKTRTLLDFLSFQSPNLYYDNPKWDDRRPFIAETRNWFRKLAQGFWASRNHTSATNGHREPDSSALQASVAESTAVARQSAAAQVRIVSSFDQIELDEAGWNALAGRSDTNTVFQTHQWARSWSAVYGPGYETLLITASGPSGTQAVAPLVIEQGVSRERVVRFLGDGRADYCDVLAPSGQPELTEALFTALLSSGRWDRIELNNLPANSQSVAALRACCQRGGYAILADDDVVCPALRIEGREQEARQIFNKPSLRRRQNYFEKNGTLDVRHLKSVAEIAPLLDRFFDQHVARWAGTDSPSLFLDPRNREFYRELTESLAGSPWLLFSVAEYNGQPIAFHYGFDYHGTVTWYKPSFDMAFAQRSPGLTLLRHLIDYAIHQGRRELDFTVGQEPFKARFTNTARRTLRLHIFRDQVRFTLERANRSLRSAVKRASRG